MLVSTCPSYAMNGTSPNPAAAKPSFCDVVTMSKDFLQDSTIEMSLCSYTCVYAHYVCVACASLLYVTTM